MNFRKTTTNNRLTCPFIAYLTISFIAALFLYPSFVQAQNAKNKQVVQTLSDKQVLGSKGTTYSFGAGQTVVIPAGATVYIEGSLDISDNNTTLIVEGNLVIGGSLALKNGSISVRGSGNLLVRGSFSGQTGSLSVSNETAANVLVGGAFAYSGTGKDKAPNGSGDYYVLGAYAGNKPASLINQIETLKGKDPYLYNLYMGITCTGVVNPSMLTSPKDVKAICKGNSLVFQAYNNGNFNYDDTYSFYVIDKNGGRTLVQGPLIGDRSNTYSAGNLKDGDYVEVIVVNKEGCSGSLSYGPLSVAEGFSTKPLLTADPNPMPLGSAVKLTTKVEEGHTLRAFDYKVSVGGKGESYINLGSEVVFPNQEPSRPSFLGGELVSVTVYDSNGCQSTSDPVTIQVGELPKVEISADKTTLCKGDAVTVSLSKAEGTPKAYAYYRNDKPIDVASGSTLQLTDIASGDKIYMVATYDNNITSRSNTLEFVVNELPHSEISIQDVDKVFCFGEGVSVVASEGFSTYKLFEGENLLKEQSSAVFIYKDLSAGKHLLAVQVVDANGCSSKTESLEVNVLPSPTANPLAIEPNVTSACFGSTLKIRAPEGGNTYQLIVNDGNKGNPQNSPTFTLADLPAGDVEVKVRVSSTNGCTAVSDSIPIKIKPLPDLTLSPMQPAPVCAGTEVRFEGRSTTGVSYQYKVDGKPVEGSGSTFVSSSLVNGSIVTLTTTDANGCSASIAAEKMVVKPVPTAVLTSSDADNILCKGSSVTFTAPEGGTKYMFKIGDSLVDNGNANSITRNDLVDGQQISVVVTSVDGCVSKSSAPVIITVHPKPGVPNDIKGNFNPVELLPDPYRYASGGLSGVDTYRWEVTPDGFGSTGANGGREFLVNWAESGMFKIRVYGHNIGCGDGSFKEKAVRSTVTISPADTPMPNTNVFCKNRMIRFTTNASGWLGDFALKGFQWTISDPNGVVIDIYVDGKENNTLEYTPEKEGSFSVKVCHLYHLFGLGIPSNPLVFNVGSQPSNLSLEVVPSLKACKGTPITITANPKVVNYEFKVNANTVLSGPANSYTSSVLDSGAVVTVVASNACGTSSISTSPIAIKTSRPLSLSASPNPMCKNGTATLTALPNDGLSYEFFIDGQSKVSGAQNTYSPPQGTLKDKSKVRALMTDECGVSTSPDVEIQELPMSKNVVLSISPSQKIFEETSVTIFATPGFTSYLFKKNGSSIGEKSSSNSIVISSPADGDIITVDVTDPCGLEGASSPIVLTVLPLPSRVLTFEPSSLVICDGDPLKVTAQPGWLRYIYKVNGKAVSESNSNAYQYVGLKDQEKVSVDIVYKDETKEYVRSSNEYVVSVKPKPTATLVSDPNKNEICFGTKVAFTASGGGAYQYLLNGKNIEGAVNSVYETTSLLDKDVVGVRVTVDGCSAVASLPAYIVNPLPIPTLIDTPVPVCAGTNIVLQLKNSYSRYEWSVKPDSLKLETNPSPGQRVVVLVPNNDELFPVRNTSTKIDAIISVIVTDEKGCRNSIPSSVTVPVHRIPRTGPPYHIGNNVSK